MTRRLLFLGDSNTFGMKPCSHPYSRERWADDVRWSARLAGALAPNWHLVEEGLPGRTAGALNQLEPYLDGPVCVPMLMQSHTPDAVAIMLGTNDLQSAFNQTPEEIVLSVANIAKLIQRSEPLIKQDEPSVTIVCPPRISEIGFRASIYKGGAQKSTFLSALFKEMAQELGYQFFDAGSVVKASSKDGIHLDESAHLTLSDAIIDFFRRSLGRL